MAKAKQIAALPLKRTKRGKLKVLLVTSRDTRRWILPKGWTMKGETDWTAAQIEAEEEAGALGKISKRPIGTFNYKKRLDHGKFLKCHVTVFPLRVTEVKRRWLERDQRDRKWVSLKRAARMVREPELQQLFKNIYKYRKKDDVIQKVRAA